MTDALWAMPAHFCGSCGWVWPSAAGDCDPAYHQCDNCGGDLETDDV